MLPTRFLEGRDEIPEGDAKNLVKNAAIICGSCTNRKKYITRRPNRKNSTSTRVYMKIIQETQMVLMNLSI
jgi:hypothetical protein